MEAKACDVHVFGLLRSFQQLQDPHTLPDLISTDPACLAGEVNLFKPLMSEAADHSSSVKYLVYSVNGVIASGENASPGDVIARWLGTLPHRVIDSKILNSGAEWKRKIMRYLRLYSKTAKPFQWKY